MLDELLDTLAQILPAWLMQQRWYGGKSRTISSARISSKTAIPGTAAVLTIVEVTYTANAEDASALYLLPLAIASAAEAETLRSTSPQKILTALPGNGALYDATANPSFRTALLPLIAATDSTTPLHGHHAGTFAPALLTESSNLSTAEQSNTSILYGRRAILKLFRRLRPGENPDVEISRFLTEIAHFPHIPAYLGDLTLDEFQSDPARKETLTTIAFLQTFAPNEGDGWEWMLHQLDSFYNAIAGSAPPRDPSAPLRRHAGSSLEAASLLGRRTAELHLALATPTTNPAFTAEPYTAHSLVAEQDRISSQLHLALDTLTEKLPALPPEAAEAAHQILSARDLLKAHIATLTQNPATFGQRIRIHGDYHLGQLLRTPGNDFLLVDFEGEPARSLTERRQKQSPLKDVAGMLRSFSYAARAGFDAALERHPGRRSILTSWSLLWESAISREFLKAYNQTISRNPALTPTGSAAQQFLAALLVEKASYELLYELNNRPAWLSIPLNGLLALTRESA